MYSHFLLPSIDPVLSEFCLFIELNLSCFLVELGSHFLLRFSFQNSLVPQAQRTKTKIKSNGGQAAPATDDGITKSKQGRNGKVQQR